MARSKATYAKREKEKKRLEKRQQKENKMKERKESSSGGKSLDDMIAFVDSEGNLSSERPDDWGKDRK